MKYTLMAIAAMSGMGFPAPSSAFSPSIAPRASNKARLERIKRIDVRL
jgi:hypothetical protein